MLGLFVMIYGHHGLGYKTSTPYSLYLISKEYVHVHLQAPPPSFFGSTCSAFYQKIPEREILMRDVLQTDRHIYHSHQYLPAAECVALSEHAKS